MSASSNLARTTDDGQQTRPWSVTDTHATLRRSRDQSGHPWPIGARFDSWLGHYENQPFSTSWPTSVMDSTTDFESVRRGSTPWWATQQQTARYANGIAATDPRCACVPDLRACGFESGHRRAALVRATWRQNDESQQTIDNSTRQRQRRGLRQRIGHGRVDGSPMRAGCSMSVSATQTIKQKRRARGTVRESAQRRSLNLRVCGFNSRPCYWQQNWRNNHGPFVYR